MTHHLVSIAQSLRDQILDFYPLAKNSEWLFFSLAKDADQLAFSLKMLELVLLVKLQCIFEN